MLLNVRVDVYHHFVPDPTLATLEDLVSQLSDKIAELTTTVNQTKDRVTNTIATMQATIDDLRSRASTPEDFAALDSLQATLNALDPTNPATL
jgi:hypothetical protein